MNTPTPTNRRLKRPFSSLSCPSSSLSPSSSSSDDNDKPHKRLALTLNRLSLTSTPNPDVEMRQRKSYEKDAFTTVIESLSTTSSDSESVKDDKDADAPFPRDEAHVTILSEIEKRLTQFPHKFLIPSTSSPDNALVLYRSPESMGLPKLERQKQEDMKNATRKRIMEKRRAEKIVNKEEVLDGYEADAEDWEDVPPRPHVNGFQRHMGHSMGNHQDGNQTNGFDMTDEDEDDGDMMDLD